MMSEKQLDVRYIVSEFNTRFILPPNESGFACPSPRGFPFPSTETIP